MNYAEHLENRFNGYDESYGIMKNTRPAPIGKTGFYARRVPPGLYSKVPATYRVINPDGKEVQSFLNKGACGRWVRQVGIDQYKFINS